MQPRDMAGKFEVNGGTGPIIRMGVVSGFLEIYKVDKTFRAKSPQALDPERVNPSMPWVISDYLDYGCAHTVVARLLIQSIDILKVANFDQAIDKEKIISVLSETREQLLNCESIMVSLKQQMDDIENSIRESGVAMDDSLRSINPFPQVRELNDLCARFLASAKRCIQNYAILTDYFYKTGIRSPRFNQIRNWAKEKLGEDSYLYILVKAQEPELSRIVNLRNFQEHPNDDKKTEIKNYTLLPEIAIKQPEWFVTGDSPRFILEDMSAILTYLFSFGESLFIHAVMENVTKKYPYKIYEIQQDKIDKNCPVAYTLSFDLATVSGIGS